MKTNIAVVIPNWNGKDFIGACLKSLQSQSQPAQIIVVDNGSSDGSSEYIAENFPQAELVRLDENTGFTGGVNRGIERAVENGCEFVVLFNNDAIADRDWLKNLLAAAKKYPGAGIVTGKFMLSDKKHIDSTGDLLSIYGISFPRGRGELDKGQYDKAGFIFGATGGASLYRIKMLKQIGLFDEDFFAYFEDADISFRAQSNGWKVYYEPKAVAYHKLGATSSKMGSFARYHSVKNIILMYNRNMPGKLFWKYKLLLFVQLARMFVGTFRDGVVGSFFHALFSAFLLLPKTLVVRHRRKKLRRVTSSEMDELLYHARPPRPPKLGESK